MTELITNKKKNCVLVALQRVSGKTDAEIFNAVRRYGYKDNHGMYEAQWISAAKDLGLELRRDDECCWGKDGLRRPTLGALLKLIGAGTYLIRVHGHLLVVENRRLVDKNYRSRPSLKRRVWRVYEVLNAAKREKGKFVRVIRPFARKLGTTARKRYDAMRAFVGDRKNVTRREILANTPYRSDDFSWDLKRGNIILTRKEE